MRASYESFLNIFIETKNEIKMIKDNLPTYVCSAMIVGF